MVLPVTPSKKKRPPLENYSVEELVAHLGRRCQSFVCAGRLISTEPEVKNGIKSFVYVGPHGDRHTDSGLTKDLKLYVDSALGPGDDILTIEDDTYDADEQ